MTSNKFKTKWELEEEDSRRYRQHQEDTFRRRLAKIAREGYKCTFDGCSSRFDNQYELTLHINEHNKECWSQLKCNQPKCGRKVSKGFSVADWIATINYNVTFYFSSKLRKSSRNILKNIRWTL